MTAANIITNTLFFAGAVVCSCIVGTVYGLAIIWIAL